MGGQRKVNVIAISKTEVEKFSRYVVSHVTIAHHWQHRQRHRPKRGNPVRRSNQVRRSHRLRRGNRQFNYQVTGHRLETQKVPKTKKGVGPF